MCLCGGDVGEGKLQDVQMWHHVGHTGGCGEAGVGPYAVQLPHYSHILHRIVFHKKNLSVGVICLFFFYIKADALALD